MISPSQEVYESKFDLLCILPSAKAIELVKPNLVEIAKHTYRGLIVSAEGTDTDIYSRCFYPTCDVAEDPVTGSAHCVIAPYWSASLNKNILTAKQGLTRQGQMVCEVENDRVLLSGQCQLYKTSEITLS